MRSTYLIVTCVALVLSGLPTSASETVRWPLVLEARKGKTPAREACSNLSSEMIEVSEDKRKAEVVALNLGPIPTTHLLLIDTSRSAGLTGSKSNAAWEQYIRGLPQGDRVAVVTFDDRLKIVHPFSTDRDAASESINLLRPRDTETALHDSIADAVGLISDFEGRKVILLATDGVDSASIEHPKASHVHELVGQTNDLSVFVIGANMSTVSDKRFADLHKFAAISGGEFERVEDVSRLGSKLAKFSARLEREGFVDYRPSPLSEEEKLEAGTWRQIKLDLKRHKTCKIYSGAGSRRFVGSELAPTLHEDPGVPASRVYSEQWPGVAVVPSGFAEYVVQLPMWSGAGQKAGFLANFRGSTQASGKVTDLAYPLVQADAYHNPDTAFTRRDITFAMPAPKTLETTLDSSIAVLNFLFRNDLLPPEERNHPVWISGRGLLEIRPALSMAYARRYSQFENRELRILGDVSAIKTLVSLCGQLANQIVSGKLTKSELQTLYADMARWSRLVALFDSTRTQATIAPLVPSHDAESQTYGFYRFLLPVRGSMDHLDATMSERVLGNRGTLALRSLIRLVLDSATAEFLSDKQIYDMRVGSGRLVDDGSEQYARYAESAIFISLRPVPGDDDAEPLSFLQVPDQPANQRAILRIDAPTGLDHPVCVRVENETEIAVELKQHIAAMNFLCAEDGEEESQDP